MTDRAELRLDRCRLDSSPHLVFKVDFLHIVKFLTEEIFYHVHLSFAIQYNRTTRYVLIIFKVVKLTASFIDTAKNELKGRWWQSIRGWLQESRDKRQAFFYCKRNTSRRGLSLQSFYYRFLIGQYCRHYSIQMHRRLGSSIRLLRL